MVKHNLIELLLESAKLAVIKGDYKLAESLYKQAVKHAEGIYGKDDPAVGEVLTYLAELYESQGRENEAGELYKRCIEIIKKWAKKRGF